MAVLEEAGISDSDHDDDQDTVVDQQNPSTNTNATKTGDQNVVWENIDDDGLLQKALIGDPAPLKNLPAPLSRVFVELEGRVAGTDTVVERSWGRDQEKDWMLGKGLLQLSLFHCFCCWGVEEQSVPNVVFSGRVRFVF